MTSRPAREDEVPRYGEVWSWEEDGSPMMVIGPYKAGATVIRRWLFIELGGTQQGEIRRMSLGYSSGPMEGWYRHD